jgi:hypothetical protein
MQDSDAIIQQKIQIDTENMQDAVLPVGEPFSRLRYDRSIWKPVTVDPIPITY